MYLPRQTPSMSMAPTFTFFTPFSSSQRLSVSVPPESRGTAPPRTGPPRSLARARRATVGCVRTFALGRVGIGTFLPGVRECSGVRRQPRPHRLALEVAFQRVVRQITAPAGLLVAAERRGIVELVEAVDPHHAALHLASQRVRLRHVARPQ